MTTIQPSVQPSVSPGSGSAQTNSAEAKTSNRTSFSMAAPHSSIKYESFVTTLGQINAGLNAIPQGTDGTVLAIIGAGSVAEVAFGPPVSSDEFVTQNLLGIA